MLWQNSTPFGQVDPQFALDLSFYTFELPFFVLFWATLLPLVILSLMIVTAVQYLYGGLRLQPKGERATRAAQAQLSALLAVFLLLKAVAYYLDRFGLVTKSEELVRRFHRTEIHRCLRGAAGIEYFDFRRGFGGGLVHLQYFP